jgi:hypothetical protein
MINIKTLQTDAAMTLIASWQLGAFIALLDRIAGGGAERQR